MRSIQVSFAAGEISPRMQGRLDTREYGTGAKTVQNFVPTPQGALIRRPGLQHVSSAISDSSISNLLPFIYNTDEAVALEMGDSLVRLHSLGQTVLWGVKVGAFTQSSSSVEIVGDTLTFDTPHGLSDGDELRFHSDDTIPGGLDVDETYTAVVVDALTISLTNGGAVNLNSVGSGTLTCWRADGLATDFVPQQDVIGFTAGSTNTVTFAAAHGLSTGDAVKLGDDGLTVTYPTAMNNIDVYYAIRVGAAELAFATTRQNALDGVRISLDPIATAGGTFELYRHYLVGEMFYYPADGQAYYTTTEHTITGSIYNLSALYQDMPTDGTYQFPSPYPSTAVRDLNSVQSNDILTVTHPDYAPRELRRMASDWWHFETISFGSSVAAPEGLAVTEDRGESAPIYQETTGGDYDGSNRVARFDMGVSGNARQVRFTVSSGDPVWIEWISGTSENFSGASDSGRYIVWDSTSDGTTSQVELQTVDGTILTVPNGTTNAFSARIYFASSSASDSENYKVTSVDVNGIESTPSDAVASTNILDVSGSSNLLTWTARAGAQKYRIYKEENGLYGRIGETEATSFTDDNIDPDGAFTPPIQDTGLSGTDYPRACAYHQQRRAFAGTTLNPRQIWFTKSGTESDLTYSLPTQADDRISATIAARRSQTIRHIVPLRRVILFSSEGEWIMDSVDGELFTPDTIEVQQHSEIGSSTVPPIIVDSQVLFCAKRGGHIYQMGFDLQTQSYEPIDQSLRAAHLFDGYEILDSSFGRAPYPIAWWVSTSGQLLSLTTIPREGVRGWAKHDTDGGTFESVCVIPEGEQDSVYVVVQRGSARSIERMVPTVTTSLEDDVYMDRAVTYDGLNTSSRTVTLTGGGQWRQGGAVTIATSSPYFATGVDETNEIEVRDGDDRYRIRIDAVTSGTVATGTLLVDLPSSLRDVAITSWAYCKRVIDGLAHLEGEEVYVMRDGVLEATTKTVSGGAVTVAANAAKVHVGRSYTSELEPLPLVVPQTDGAGQGRRKNVQSAHLRVDQTAGLVAGVAGLTAESIEGLSTTALATGEFPVTLRGNWNADGTLRVVQSLPLPATILAMTLEVEFGD